MAGIDKTYVHSYKEWKNYIDWARKTEFTCPNGMKLYPIDYCYYTEKDDSWVKEEFDNNEDFELTLMNTPCELDYFLIKYCPFEFIQKSMREWSYSEKYVNEIKNGESDYDKFVRPKGGKHFKWIKKPKYKNTLKNKKYCINIIINGGFTKYNEYYDAWILPNELGDWTSCCADVCHSIKALIRKFKKWNLPINSKIQVFDSNDIYECLVCK